MSEKKTNENDENAGLRKEKRKIKNLHYFNQDVIEANIVKLDLQKSHSTEHGESYKKPEKMWLPQYLNMLLSRIVESKEWKNRGN